MIRLQKLAERTYPESQCGFRAERSTIDIIFSFRHLQEKCIEHHMPLYIALIDLTKAFDLVSREGLFKVLPKIGCPPKLQSMIESFHTDTKGTVQFNGSFSEPFTQEELLSLMDCFSQACKDFGLTISLKKTNVLGQDT